MANPDITDRADRDEYEVEIIDRPIGVRLIHTDKIIVGQVLENGVGSKLGIKKGDILIEINGTSIIELENDKAIELFDEANLPFLAKFSKAIYIQKHDDNKKHIEDKQGTNLYNLAEWNVINVLMWFIEYCSNKFDDDTKLKKYQAIIWKNRIDGSKLKTLTQTDLYNIGIYDKNDCYAIYMEVCNKLGIENDIKPLSDDIIDDIKEEKQEPNGILDIFGSDKYDYSDCGRFIDIAQCLALQRICYVLGQYVKWINECIETQKLLKYKENLFKDETLMIDITSYEAIDSIMNNINYNIVLLLNDFNYIKLNYLDATSHKINNGLTSASSDFRRRLIDFYTIHNPTKLSDVEGIDEVLRRYAGREDKLFSDLNRKYNVCAKNKINSNRNYHIMHKIFCKNVEPIKKDCNFILRRNFRDRLYFQDNNIMKEWYFSINAESIMTQEIFDKIYCFFMHSYENGLILTEKEENIINKKDEKDEQDEDEINWYKSDALLRIGCIIEEKRKNLCLLLNKMNLSKRRYKKKNNRFLTNYENQYSVGHKYYYLDYHRKNEKMDFHNLGYRYCDWFVAAKYESLKAELMFNNISQITFGEWNILKLKSQKYQQIRFVRQFLSDVTIPHLISLLVYTNCDAIQRKFRQTFFKIPINERDESLKQRHSNFCHFSRLLRELINKYGSRKYFYDKYIDCLYHGININTPYRIILSTYSFLSFSTSYQCIVSFSDNNGLILELKENEYFFCSPKYINLSIFSDYPAENEYLFIPGELGGSAQLLEIQNVIDCKLGYDYHLYLKSLFIIRQMCICGWYFICNGHERNIFINNVKNGIISKLICHELSLYSQSFMSLQVVPKYINILLHDFFLSIEKIKIIWKAWNEDQNDENKNEFGFKSIIQKIFIKADETFLNFSLILLLFPNLNQIQIINDVNYKRSKLFLSTDLLDTIFVDIKKMENKSRKQIFCLNKILLIAPKQSQLSIFRAIEIYQQIYKKIGWDIKRGNENDHVVIEKIK